MKHGFTIIEILAVIVIMGIMLVLVLPNLIGISDKNKQNKYNQLVDNIKLSAETYVGGNYDNPTYPMQIPLQTLIDAGYLDGPLTNPLTGNELDYTANVLATKNADNSITYTYPDTTDITKPIVVFGTNGSLKYVKTKSTIVTVSDDIALNASSLKYLWTTSTTVPTEASFSTTFTNGSTITTPTSVSGTYYLWILAKDTTSNTTIKKSNPFKIDNIAPIITMNGSSPITINVGSTYTDAGATAIDGLDGNLTSSIVTTSTVVPTVVGAYTVTYNVSDSSSNVATTVTRIVNVIDPFGNQRTLSRLIGSSIQYASSYGANFPRMYAIKPDGTVMINQDNWSFYINGAVDGYRTLSLAGISNVMGYGGTAILTVNSSKQVIEYICSETGTACTTSALTSFGSNVVQTAETSAYQKSYSASLNRMYALNADGTVMVNQDNWSFYLSTAIDGYRTLVGITGAKFISGYSLQDLLVIDSSKQVTDYACNYKGTACTGTVLTSFGTNVAQVASSTVYASSYSTSFSRVYTLNYDGTVMMNQDNWSFYLSTAVDGYRTLNITGAKAITTYGLQDLLVLNSSNQVVDYSCPYTSTTCTSTILTNFGTL